MLSKNDVYTFIKKVQAKAIKSVKEKYDAELTSVIETTLNQPENLILKHAIEQIEQSFATGIEARNLVRKYVPRCDSWNNYFNRRDVRRDIFADDHNFPNGFETIGAVHANFTEKLRRIDEEYAKITQIVKSKKNRRTRQNSINRTRF